MIKAYDHRAFTSRVGDWSEFCLWRVPSSRLIRASSNLWWTSRNDSELVWFPRDLSILNSGRHMNHTALAAFTTCWHAAVIWSHFYFNWHCFFIAVYKILLQQSLSHHKPKPRGPIDMEVSPFVFKWLHKHTKRSERERMLFIKSLRILKILCLKLQT